MKKHLTVWNAVPVLVGMLLVPPAFSFFERHFPSPVVENMQAVTVKREGGRIVALVVGDKMRDCEVIKDSWSGYISTDANSWEEVRFEFLRDKAPGSSKPVGRNSFGYWAWEDVGDVKQVMTTIRHVCKRIPVLTTIGPFDVPRSAIGEDQ